MAKSKQEETTALAIAGANPQLPSFMQGEAVQGLQLVEQYIVPPRIKVVQPMKGEAYADFSEGDTVLTPQRTLLAKRGEPFFVTPLLFYPEWYVVNPLEKKDSLPMIRERTIDPKSEIARKARNKDTWFEPFPDEANSKLQLRYVEALVFLVELREQPGMQGLPVALSFSKGEHGSGSRFAALLKMRSASIFAGVYECVVPERARSNAKGRWYGIDVSNPKSNDVSPWIESKEEFERLKAEHEKLLEQYKAGLVQVDYDEEDQAHPVSSSDEAKY